MQTISLRQQMRFHVAQCLNVSPGVSALLLIWLMLALACILYRVCGQRPSDSGPNMNSSGRSLNMPVVAVAFQGQSPPPYAPTTTLSPLPSGGRRSHSLPVVVVPPPPV